MALKALMLRKKIDDKQKALDELRAMSDDFAKRESELAAAINELTAESTDEERNAVEAEIEKFDGEKADHEKNVSDLENEIEAMRTELDALEAKQDAPAAPETTETPAAPVADTETRKENVTMAFRKSNAVLEMRSKVAPFIKREEVTKFLSTARTCMAEKRALSGAGVLIPDVFLGVLRENVVNYSKLYSRVNVRPLTGTGRMAVAGTVPEAVWTEMCANLNELDLAFNSVEVDGYKVGGYMAICNATIEDSEIDLAAEIMVALAQSIGIALDKAILYGTGSRMPLGVMARLAQTAQPADYPANARPWVDLHTSNIRTVAAGVTGTALISEITLDSGYAKGKYSRGAKLWCMNETTYTMLKANAINVTAAGAIVSGVDGTMPVTGGDVIVLDFILTPPGHMDPCGYVVPDILKAQELAKSRGGKLVFIASVLGTTADWQDIRKQEQELRDAGVLVCRTNYRAALLASEIIKLRRDA